MSAKPPRARNFLPRVSVILPVFNGEAFVAESLDSILGQDVRRQVLPLLRRAARPAARR
jgi:cellulose synthase/poly-beta-1,6-N-acetylglucosamine synthase-like glycosyltransferase